MSDLSVASTSTVVHRGATASRLPRRYLHAPCYLSILLHGACCTLSWTVPCAEWDAGVAAEPLVHPAQVQRHGARVRRCSAANGVWLELYPPMHSRNVSIRAPLEYSSCLAPSAQSRSRHATGRHVQGAAGRTQARARPSCLQRRAAVLRFKVSGRAAACRSGGRSVQRKHKSRPYCRRCALKEYSFVTPDRAMSYVALWKRRMLAVLIIVVWCMLPVPLYMLQVACRTSHVSRCGYAQPE